jgi:stalled ribosome alternative rescue factor ArfA
MEKMDRWTEMRENEWQTLATSHLKIQREGDNEKQKKCYVRQAKKWRTIMWQKTKNM